MPKCDKFIRRGWRRKLTPSVVTAAKEIVSTEGFAGLFGRGLPTRLLTNGLQGLLFSILWKFFADL
jgi:hypothetical protein